MLVGHVQMGEWATRSLFSAGNVCVCVLSVFVLLFLSFPFPWFLFVCLLVFVRFVGGHTHINATKICAIVGGVFTVYGIINNVVRTHAHTNTITTPTPPTPPTPPCIITASCVFEIAAHQTWFGEIGVMTLIVTWRWYDGTIHVYEHCKYRFQKRSLPNDNVCLNLQTVAREWRENVTRDYNGY